MPVLKIKKNGVWEYVGGVSGHTHEKNEIVDFPSSLPANGGNADTLDGKHAEEFALKSDLGDFLPEVTAADNGKFLRVVNGVWTASSIPNAEEAEF